jgi:hypothetical protein
MRNCQNADLRDELPDFAADRMTGTDRARVAAHIAECVECAAEVELLRGAHRAMTRDLPRIDVARIMAALPAPPHATARPELVRADAGPMGEASGVRPIAGHPDRVVRHRPMWTGWRVAAAVSTIAVGGLSVAVIRDLASTGRSPMAGPAVVASPIAAPVGSSSGSSSAVGAGPDTQGGVPADVGSSAAGSASPTTTTMTPTVPPPAGVRPSTAGTDAGQESNPTGDVEAAASAGAGMAVAGSISDLSDGEVEGLLNDLDGLEASPSDEPDAAAPGLHAAVTP